MSETHGQSSSQSQQQEQQQHQRVKVDNNGNVMELRSHPRQVCYNLYNIKYNVTFVICIYVCTPWKKCDMDFSHVILTAVWSKLTSNPMEFPLHFYRIRWNFHGKYMSF